MNKAGIKAIKTALANVGDNLYRYKHFMSDGATTGNGERKEDVVAKLEAEYEDLRKALEEAEAS